MTDAVNNDTPGEISDKGVTLPIQWNVPKELPTLHATNLIIQHTKDEFIVMFFEIRPPLILDPDGAEEYLQNLGKVEAECLVRLAITPDRLENFIEAFQSSLSKFKAQNEDQEDESE